MNASRTPYFLFTAIVIPVLETIAFDLVLGLEATWK